MSFDLSKFKPMLAAETEDYDWSKLQYPIYTSPKLDGIRCVTHPTLGPVSRSLKPIPNTHIRTFLANPALKWLDGEICVGPASDPLVFNRSQSGVMSQGGTPDFTYHVFDNFEAAQMCNFGIRYQDARWVVDEAVNHDPTISEHVKLLPQKLIGDYDELLAAEEEAIALGFEGLIIRSPSGKYKFNRSTQREQGMLKLKRFADAEARIIGYEPLMRNENEAFLDERGYQKRGYSKDGKVADDTRIGKFHAIVLTGPFKDVSFSIGSGLNDTDRLQFRASIDSLIGQTFSFKYQAHGSKDAPRTPIWKGLRGVE